MTDYRADRQFNYDEEPLEQGHYREWFWKGLGHDPVTYLRQPARAYKVEQEPVAYDGWEAVQPRKWQEEAVCAGADPVVFFSEGQYPRREFLASDAKWREYCPQCPVRETCLQAARDSGSVGIFGGKLFRFDKASSKIQEIDDRIPTT